MKKVIAFFLLLTGLLTYAQEQTSPSYNQNRSEWMQIKAGQITVIFPGEMEDKAQVTAKKLLLLQESLGKTLGNKLSKWPVILNNSTLIPNGYVTLMPRRSEWYSVPAFESDITTDWFDLLAIHEGRHMYQLDNTKTGFIRLAHLLYGQTGQGAMQILTYPLWAPEGDAVLTETLFTDSGRGRTPSFEIELKANLLEGDLYSYDKAYLGSYKDFIPNHYVLGYFLNAYARREYGSQAIQNLLQTASWIPLPGYSLSWATYFTFGNSLNTEYRTAMEELREIYQTQVSHSDPVEAKHYTDDPDTSFWTIYYNPQASSDDSILTVQYQWGRRYELIQLGEDNKSLWPDYPGKSDFQLKDNKIVSTISSLHPLFPDISYEDIFTYDLKTGKKRQITKEGRYFMPRFHPVENKIIALYLSQNMEMHYRILDAETGSIISEIPNPQGYTIFTPTWNKEGTRIAFVRQKDGLRELAVHNLKSGEEQILIQGTNEGFRHLFWNGEYIFYSSPYSGTDNIFAIHTETLESYQLTRRKYGAFYPYVQNETLYFSEYANKMGYQVSSIPLKELHWIPKDEIQPIRTDYFASLESQESPPDLDKAAQIPDLPVKPYYKWTSGLKPHSWGILPGPRVNTISTQLFGQDLHGNFSWNAGPYWNYLEEKPGFFANIALTKFYPHLNFSMYYQEREENNQNWSELEALAGITFPFNLSKGAYSSQLSLSGQTGLLTDVSNQSDTTYPIYVNLQWYRYLISGGRHLFPRKAASMDLYHHMDWPETRNRLVSGGTAKFNIPGPSKDSVIRLQGGGEYHKGDEGSFLSTNLSSIRGYLLEPLPLSRIQGGLSLDSNLGFPDINIPGLLYINKASLGVFSDLWVKNPETQPVIENTLGLDMNFGFIPIRIKPLQLSAGLRAAYRIQEQTPVLELLIMGQSVGKFTQNP